MSNKLLSLLKNKSTGLVIMTILLVLITLTAFLTDLYRGIRHSSPLVQFAVAHHTWIMAVLVIICVGFGFLWSHSLYGEILKTRKRSRSMMDVVYLFLNIDERKIVDFLVKHNGETSQAEISRLPNMNRVRAHRALQRMEDKQLIDIRPHGKMRYVSLKENILRTIRDELENGN